MSQGRQLPPHVFQTAKKAFVAASAVIRAKLFRVRLLPGYVFQEFSKTFIVAFLAVIIVLFIGMGVKQVSVQKGLDFVSVFSLFPFLMAKAMPYALPFGTVCACALAYGRLSGDNEISAMRTSGIHLHHVVTPVLVFGLLASAVTFAMDDLLSPVLRYQSERVQDRVLRNLVKEFGSIGSPTYSWPVNDTEKIYLYVDRIAGDELRGVAICLTEKDRVTQTIVAEYARLKYDVDASDPHKKRLTIILKAGSVTTINPNRPARINIVPARIGGDQETFLPYEFNSLASMSWGDPSYNSTAENQMRAAQLKDKLATLYRARDEGDKSPDDVSSAIVTVTRGLNDTLIEIYGRLALATSCFFLALVTVPLSIIVKRGQMLVAFFIGLVLVTVYMVAFLVGSKFLGMGGYVHPAIAVWLPNILLLLVGIWLFRKIFRV